MKSWQLISRKPWLELLDKAENPLVGGGFLHLALAGAIGEAGGEFHREG
jgi:hypothetical protein